MTGILAADGGGGGAGYYGGAVDDVDGCGGGGGSSNGPAGSTYPTPTNSGDGSVTITYTVQSETTLSLKASPNPSNAGDKVTFKAKLGGGGTGSKEPTGSISLAAYTTPNCSDPIPSFTLGTDNNVTSGNGTYTIGKTVPPGPGTYYVGAYYTGDDNNSPATTGCGAVVLVVNPNTTSLTVIASPNPASPGAPVTFTSTLSGGGTGANEPTGTITVKAYTASNCSSSSLAFTLGSTNNVTAGNGTYTIGTTTPPHNGTYYIEASYSGDPNNTSSHTGCDGTTLVVSFQSGHGH